MGTRTPEALPDQYAVTVAFLLLRAAERFGQNPCTWIDTLSPGEQAQLIAFEGVRQAQEVAKL